MPKDSISPPTCWYCGAAASARRAEVESVIEMRTQNDGGPFLTLTCAKCRTRCGALRNRSGAWMLYPLEGAQEPSLIDRIVPRTGRERLARARAWWLRNAGNVERFRATRDDVAAPRESPPPSPPPPPPRRARPKPGAAPSAAPPTPTGPRAVLGVAADATLADVRRAWRAAVKRWHPDRIPTRDPVVLEEAMRRFGEIRAAYEALSAELSR